MKSKEKKKKLLNHIRENEDTIKHLFKSKTYVNVDLLEEVALVDKSISPLFKILFYFSNYLGERSKSKCFISITNIAKKLHINRSHCNELITCLIESGIIHRAGIPRSKLRREWHLGENVNCSRCNPLLPLLEYSVKQEQVCKKIEEVVEATKGKVEVFEKVLKVPEAVEVAVEAVEAVEVDTWDTAAKYREKTPETFSDYKEQTYSVNGNTWNNLSKTVFDKLGSTNQLTIKSAIKIWENSLKALGIPYKERYQECNIKQKIGDITSRTEADFAESCFLYLEKKRLQNLKWMNDRDLFTSKPINFMLSDKIKAIEWDTSGDSIVGFGGVSDIDKNIYRGGGKDSYFDERSLYLREGSENEQSENDIIFPNGKGNKK